MKLFSEHNRIAKDMLVAISGIEAEIDATLSLNYRALQSLKINRSNGWCAELYTRDSEELWNKQLEITPSDTDTMHHLAILHHSRAFDLEHGVTADKSDADWVKAEEYWDKLLHSDEFWERLIGDTEGITPAHKKKLKDIYYLKILETHFTMAYSPEMTLKRGKFHVTHVLTTEVNREIINEIRRKVYESYINKFPDEIWIGSNTDITVLTDACVKIKKILDVDPECLPALMDIIRIQYRVLEALAQKKAENQDDKEAVKTIYLEINEMAKQWQAYFDLCVLYKDELTYDLIENIIIWYRYNGDNKGNIADWEGAIKCFENILLLDPENEQDKKYALESIPIYHALYARDLAEKNAGDAKSECNKAAARDNHTPQSYFYLAQAYQSIVYKETRKNLSLREKDNALKMCEKGMSLASLETNKNNILWREHYIKLKQDIIMQKAFEGALDCIQHTEFDNAIKHIDEALNKGAESFFLYLYRCKCFIETNKIDKAKLDFIKAETLVKTDEEKEALENISLQLDGQDISNKYIKPALEAFKSKDFNKAIKILTEAINEGYDECLIYIIRCQCYVGINDIDKAKADITKAEKSAKTEADKKDIQELKKYVFINPPTINEIDQYANNLLSELKSGLPYNFAIYETNCLSRIKELIKNESKKWTINSLNIVAESFAKEVQNNFNHYCYRKY